MVLSRFWLAIFISSILFIIVSLFAGNTYSVDYVLNGKKDDPVLISEKFLKEIPAFIKMKQLDYTKLPSDWNTFAFLDKTQQIGDEIIRKNEIVALRVPSAVVPGDSNIIINPLHPSIKHIKVLKEENFAFDGRLFRSV